MNQGKVGGHGDRMKTKKYMSLLATQDLTVSRNLRAQTQDRLLVTPSRTTHIISEGEWAKTPPSRRLQVQGLLSKSAEPSSCAGSSKRKLNRTGVMQARTAAGSTRTSRSISKVGHISQARRAERRNKERGNKKTQPFESTCLRKNKSM